MLREMLTEHMPQKAIALVIAVTLVAMKRDEERMTATTAVRVRVTMPDDRVLVSPTLEEVMVTFEGTAGDVRPLDGATLPDLQVRLTGLEGGQLTFDSEQFTGIPREVKITAVRPPGMLVQLEERVTATVPVEPVFEGEPGRGYRVTQWSVEPPRVTVEGAKSAVERLQNVKTRVVPLGDAVHSMSVLTTLQPAPRFVGFLGPHSVRVTVQVDEKTGTRVITARPVEVRGAPPGLSFELSPPTVDITLHGPVRLLDELKVEEMMAYVDVSELNPRRKRPRLMVVSFEPPPGLKSSELKPERVTLLQKEATPQPNLGPDAGVP